MKNKILKPLAVIFAALMFTSCIKDLDVTPKDPNIVTSLTVYNTPGAYKEGLAKLYATFSVSGQQGPSGQPDIAGIDEGFGNYLRQYWNAQELTTDEAVIAWNDASIKDFHWQTWAPNDVFIAALYSRIMYTVALCNEYIRATAGNTNADIVKYHAEARFLRALAYYHALDLYGNPPFVTEADAPGAFFPKQTTRAALYTYIETELKAIENGLGAPKFEYARADQAALWTLLAKLYLNAKVYIGQDKNSECVTYCNKVINSGYTLAPKYANNFTADNNLSTEMIFPITADGKHTQTYGGMVYLIHAQIGGSMPPAQFGVGGGWGGLRTTKAFVNKFADTSGATDKRAMFWSAGQKLEINDIGQFTDGWAITKFSNLTSTGAAAPHAHPDFVDTDYPVFRLADVYLMYAEAVLRGGTSGNAATALGYVNALRQRAYSNTSGNITSGQLTLDFILDERARELYWEGHRRTDLVRFGKFTSASYLWPWKGKVAEGKATESFRDLFPIPSNDLGANPTLKQNPGY
ncbi:MAG: RagB/SusD family nutrient uptake outer membrane protein [Bacteroidota bacterium]|nr:RagB/SusD family nutrient uptake outer membrane protein [Odoribacter sp.]MDP3642234.1 RagB/SusD family nutrient uptake outer membrane protein [Bacteroidota bacterium]